MKTINRDFAKNRTDFSTEMDRMRGLMFAQLWASIEPKGLISKLIYWICKPRSIYAN